MYEKIWHHFHVANSLFPFSCFDMLSLLFFHCYQEIPEPRQLIQVRVYWRLTVSEVEPMPITVGTWRQAGRHADVLWSGSWDSLWNIEELPWKHGRASVNWEGHGYLKRQSPSPRDTPPPTGSHLLESQHSGGPWRGTRLHCLAWF